MVNGISCPLLADYRLTQHSLRQRFSCFNQCPLIVFTYPSWRFFERLVSGKLTFAKMEQTAQFAPKSTFAN